MRAGYHCRTTVFFPVLLREQLSRVRQTATLRRKAIFAIFETLEVCRKVLSSPKYIHAKSGTIRMCRKHAECKIKATSCLDSHRPGTGQRVNGMNGIGILCLNIWYNLSYIPILSIGVDKAYPPLFTHNLLVT